MAITIPVQEKLQQLSPKERAWVKERARQLIAEEMTLRELRRARKLTQARLAKAQGVSQDSISRLEKRSDLLLSTLRKTLQAMGGSLSLMVQFKDRPPVKLNGFSDGAETAKPRSKRRARMAHA